MVKTLGVKEVTLTYAECDIVVEAVENLLQDYFNHSSFTDEEEEVLTLEYNNILIKVRR